MWLYRLHYHSDANNALATIKRIILKFISRITYVLNTMSNYYGTVLPRRRPHYVSMLSVCLSVPCLHLEKKRNGLGRPNLAGRVPGTRAPRGPMSRIPAVAWPRVGQHWPRGKTKRPRKTKLGRKGPWGTSIPWTNFKVPSCCLGGPTVPESQCAST